jgi:AcrR family transcriptional regulator
VAAKEKVPVAWLEAALEAWAEGGLAAVAVEPLARRLGLSKGPFYWRFRSRRDLVLAALAHWEQRETEAVIAGLAAVGDPRERLVRLFRAVTRTRGRRRLELAIVACAHDPLVRPCRARGSATWRMAIAPWGSRPGPPGTVLSWPTRPIRGSFT